jgi:hypothetical protein
VSLPSFDGSAGDPEVNRLAQLAEGKNVLELGTLAGRSCIAMARTAKHVTTIDDHTGANTLSIFLGNLETYGVADKVLPVIKRTEVAVPELTDTYELAFIDADHSYEGALRDLRNVNRVITSDGIICCHDYEDLWNLHFGVDRAVDEFCAETGWKVTEVIHSMAVLRRDATATTERPCVHEERLRDLMAAIEAAGIQHNCIGPRCQLCGCLALIRGAM